MSQSPIRVTSDSLHTLDIDERSVDITADGAEFTSSLKGGEMSMTSGRGEQIHPSMIPGFLDHVAKKHDLEDGEELREGLDEVFRESERRLVR